MRSIGRDVGVVLASLTVPVLAAEAAKPKIQVDEPVYHFGRIWDNKAIEHAFVVKNVGQAPLEIKRIRSTCGCTVVKAKPQSLAPGATTEITVRFNPRGLRSKIRKSVIVESNDPVKPALGLAFSGEILRPITMTPEMARFQALDPNGPSAIELTLTNNMLEPMVLSEATCSAPNVSAQITEIEKGKKYKVTLTAKPPYPGDVFHGRMTLKTGLSTHPEHAISFFGRLPPAVVIQPSTAIRLGTLDNSKEYTKTVRLVSTTGKPFEITEVSSSNWRVTPVVKEVVEKQEYQVQITARGPYAWGPNRAYVTFKIGSPSSRRLTLTVYGDLPPPIKVTPATLLFRDLGADRGGQAAVTLDAGDSTSVTFPSIRSSLPNVRAEVETLEAGKRYKLTATATPPMQTGRLEGEIVLATTHPKMKTLSVPVRSFPIRGSLPAVSVVPDPVLIIPPTGSTTRPASARLIVRASGDDKVLVTKVEVTHKDITTSLEPRKGSEDKMTFVRLTIPATAKLNPNGETITIHTDHKTFAKITRKIARYGTPGARFHSHASSARLSPRPPAKPPGRANP